MVKCNVNCLTFEERLFNFKHLLKWTSLMQKKGKEDGSIMTHGSFIADDKFSKQINGGATIMENRRNALEEHEEQLNPAKCNMNDQLKMKKKKRTRTRLCPFLGCEEHLHSDVKLRLHLTNVHMIDVNECESITFTTTGAYKSWQEKLQDEIGVWYKKISDYPTRDGTKITHFRCVSGELSQTSTGIAIRKSCPSSISLYDEGKGNIVAKYFPKHYGHYIRVSNPQTLPCQPDINPNGDFATSVASILFNVVSPGQQISRFPVLFSNSKLKEASGIASLQKILSAMRLSEMSLNEAMNTARSSFIDDNFSKLYRTHLEAFENLKENYKFWYERQSLKPRNEFKSLIAKLGDLKDDNPLYFEEILDDDDLANEENYMFVIINSIQIKLLKEFGECGIVCVDIILDGETEDTDFNMMCVNVIDAVGEPVPCAICISDRENYAIARRFFSVIKSKTGVIAPRIFICEHEEFYDQWKYVMVEAKQLFLASWLIDAEWRSRIFTLNASSDDKLGLYIILRNLMEIPTIANFEGHLEAVIREVVPKFELKIEQYLLSKAKLWAKCYRHLEVRNCDLKLESIHREMCAFRLSKEFLGDSKLDSLILSVLDLVRWKCCERLTRLETCLKTRLSEQGQRHELSFSNNLQVQSLSHNKWIVKTEEEDFCVYRTKFPPCNECKYICEDCDVCIHKFTCTCFDNLILFNLCSHIHFVSRNVKHRPENIEIIDYSKECNQCREQRILADTLRKDIHDAFIQLKEQLPSLTDVETLTVIKESFKHINKMVEENNAANNF